LDICDEVCREEAGDTDKEEIEEESNWDVDNVSLVGLRAVATDVCEAIAARTSHCRRVREEVANCAKGKLRNVASSRCPCFCIIEYLGIFWKVDQKRCGHLIGCVVCSNTGLVVPCACCPLH
jgi:hypothetical protein